MQCDNKTTMYVVNNLIFHERTKHIKANFHFIKNLIQNGTISMTHVPLEEQVADIFTKHLFIGNFVKYCNKLSMIDIYILA